MGTQPLRGRELLLAALRHERCDSVPWVPFAGVHAGRLRGYSALEILTDRAKLLESLLAVNQTYDPDGQPVLFDLQVEAEILGCNLVWVDKGPPTVVSHPLAEATVIPSYLPTESDGRLPMILDTMRAMKRTVGHKTALYGLVTGPLTLASHLRGTEVFMDMFDHPEFLAGLLAYCGEVVKRVATMYIEAGMDVIAVVDPVVSQISPRHFTKMLGPVYTDVFAFIRAKGVFSSFFVCGDATKNLDAMCHTAPDSISVDENIDLLAAKRVTDRYNVAIGGNIPLTTRMLLGSQQDNMKFVVDLLAQVGEVRNFILAPGCDMPYDVPVENTVGVVQAVRDPEGTREMLANYRPEEIDLSTVVLPDYAHLNKPLVEVFTLDSDTCAACSYMRDAALRAVDGLEGLVDVQEYKFTSKDNIARMMKLGVKNLPSIYINGELRYSSIIPSNRELTDDIKRHLD